MVVELIIVLGGILGFAYIAKQWLPLRLSGDYRLIPKNCLWMGVRDFTISLGILIVFVFVTSHELNFTGPTVATDYSQDPGIRFVAGSILFGLGIGMGRGISGIFAGTLSYVTKGPYQGDIDPSSPSKYENQTDEYGQLKKK